MAQTVGLLENFQTKMAPDTAQCKKHMISHISKTQNQMLQCAIIHNHFQLYSVNKNSWPYLKITEILSSLLVRVSQEEYRTSLATMHNRFGSHCSVMAGNEHSVECCL